MASVTELSPSKDGRPRYRIRVRMGKKGSTLSMIWKPEKNGLAKMTITRQVNAAAAEFERKCKAGEVKNRAQRIVADAEAAAELAKIKTVQQYAEQVFLPAKAVVVSQKTIASYRWSLEKYVYPSPLGDMRIAEVSSAQISALLLGMQSDGQAHSSVVRMYAILSGLFKMAYKTEDIQCNPMDRVDRPVPRKDELQQDAPEAYTEDELLYILKCLRNEPLKWQTIICILVETGMRRGECLGLKWEDIDFKNLEITITGNLCYTPETGIYFSTPKNKKKRTVDITIDTARMLQNLRLEQAKKTMSKWVFTKEGSVDPMFPDSPTQYMKKIGQKYGIEHLHPHKLRHSFASVALTNGADIVSISEILGHSDTSITLRTYSHSNKEARKRASGIFQSALESAK